MSHATYNAFMPDSYAEHILSIRYCKILSLLIGRFLFVRNMYSVSPFTCNSWKVLKIFENFGTDKIQFRESSSKTCLPEFFMKTDFDRKSLNYMEIRRKILNLIFIDVFSLSPNFVHSQTNLLHMEQISGNLENSNIVAMKTFVFVSSVFLKTHTLTA